MSWYDDRWNFREAVTVHNAGNSQTIDIEFTVPTDLSRFWNNVQSDKHDIILTASDGKTLLDFKVGTWNYTNKTATIQIKSYALPNGSASISGKSIVVWMYWGFNDGTGNDFTGSSNASLAALSSQITAVGVAIGDPRRSGAPIISCKFEPPEQTKPRSVVTAPPGVSTHIYFDARPMLAARRTTFEGSRMLEEVDTVLLEIHHSGGSSKPAMVTEDETRVLHPGMIRTSIVTDASDVSSNYLLTLTLLTDTGRTFKFYGLLKVREINAPAA